MEGAQAVWPDWEINRPLASGSFGTVYLACHRHNPELQSAVKVIEVPRDIAQTEELEKAGLSTEQIRRHYEDLLRQYCAEIERLYLCKGTSHIMDVEDFRVIPHSDGIGGTLYIRMEMLKSLPVFLSDKQLSEEETTTLGIDICEALEICHANGILHRDIKPENIFVNDRLSTGVLYKLGDFGSAVNLGDPEQAEDVQGTLFYMAPEAANEHHWDERSDLYSLGLTLYQLMNRRRLPFLPDKQFCSYNEKSVALQTRLSGAPLPNPAEASSAFAAMLRKACAPDPANRYTSAAEMKAALLSLRKAEAQTVTAVQTRPAPSTKAKLSSGIRFCLLVALSLLCLLLGSLLLRQTLRGRSGVNSSQPTELPLITVIDRRTKTP